MTTTTMSDVTMNFKKKNGTTGTQLQIEFDSNALSQVSMRNYDSGKGISEPPISSPSECVMV